MKILAYCWNCDKEHDISNKGIGRYGLKCDCGGYVISPSGKINMKLVPENNKERRLIGQPAMLKLYRIYYYEDCGWCTEHPEDFKGEIENFNQIEEWNIDIDSTIEKISKLKVNEELEVEGLKFKCFEMTEGEYENLGEFDWW